MNYYRRFVENFSTIAAPLSDLTKKGAPDKVQWTPECQRAFDTLKSVLTANPVLTLPDLQKTFILRTDASETGIGGCLLQQDKDLLHPITYVSRKLVEREQKYGIMEKECLAIVWAVSKLGKYLLGKEFVIETDHKPLSFLEKNRSSSPRLSRWALSLQNYTFSVGHISGPTNALADILSRL